MIVSSATTCTQTVRRGARINAAVLFPTAPLSKMFAERLSFFVKEPSASAAVIAFVNIAMRQVLLSKSARVRSTTCSSF